jgi:hypothetical protein
MQEVACKGYNHDFINLISHYGDFRDGSFFNFCFMVNCWLGAI